MVALSSTQRHRMAQEKEAAMPGFMNTDGSELVGGQLPGGAGQAFVLDALGNLSITDTIRRLILAGKGFTLVTRQTSPGAGNFGVAIFNPGTNGKTVVIYSIRIYENQSAGVHEMHLTTSDPAMGNALAPVNNLAGSTNTSGVTGSYASATQTIPGTGLIGLSAQGANIMPEVLTNGEVIVLPAGANNGLGVYTNLGAAGNWGVEMGYIEY